MTNLDPRQLRLLALLLDANDWRGVPFTELPDDLRDLDTIAGAYSDRTVRLGDWVGDDDWRSWWPAPPASVRRMIRWHLNDEVRGTFWLRATHRGQLAFRDATTPVAAPPAVSPPPPPPARLYLPDGRPAPAPVVRQMALLAEHPYLPAFDLAHMSGRSPNTFDDVDGPMLKSLGAATCRRGWFLPDPSKPPASHPSATTTNGPERD